MNSPQDPAGPTPNPDVPNPNGPNPNVPKPWQPRFGIAGIMLVMVVMAVMASAAYYLSRMMLAVQPADRRHAQAVFIVFTLAAPVILVVAVSVLRFVLVRFGGGNRSSNPKRPRP